MIAWSPALAGTVYTIHEDIDVKSSFYGPAANSLAKQLRDGLGIPQNTDVLLAEKIRFASSGPIRNVSYFVNQGWIRRQDMGLHFRREVTRTYPILPFEVAAVHLFDDTVVNDTIAVPPGSPVRP